MSLIWISLLFVVNKSTEIPTFVSTMQINAHSEINNDNNNGCI